MSQLYCFRCKNITFMWTYSNLCRICKIRVHRNIPNHIPDEQVEDYRRLKNV